MKKYLLLLSCIALTFTSCFEGMGPEIPEVGNISLSDTAIEASPNGGTYKVTVTSDYSWAASTSVDWITLNITGEPTTLSFTVAPNNSSAAREGIITVFCNDYNISTELLVEQDGLNAEFSVTFSNTTPYSADATITPKNSNMTWGATVVYESYLNEGQSPADYMLSDMEVMANEIGGYYKLLLYMTASGMYATATGTNATPFSCQQSWDKSKMYLCIVGLKNVDTSLAAMDPYSEQFWTATDNSSLATAVQVVEVKTLPEPSFTVATEKSVTSSAGKFTINAPLTDKWGEGTVSVQTDAAWVTPSWENGKLTVAYAENPYAVARKAIVQLDYVVRVKIPQPWDPNYEEERYFGTTQLVLTQEKNTTVDPITLTIEVVESHYDHILVNVTPSNLKAEYYLNAVEKTDFNEYRDGDWATQQKQDLRSYQFDNYVHTGKLENFKLTINTKYASSWTWLAYAYAVDKTNKIVAGELTYKQVEVFNDSPHFTCPKGWVDNDDTFELTVSKPGTYTVQLNIEYAPKDAAIWSNTYPSSSTEFTISSYSNNIFGNNGKVTIDNTNRTITFTVVEPADWTNNYDPYTSFGLKIADAATGKTIYASPKTFRVIYRK
uniref:BACON domain-containing protein n=1 Tax=Alistipes sp. TaxID=1872444 RepID=UPI004056E4AF